MRDAARNPASALDSAALSRRIAGGDEAAFTAFYGHWFPAAFALARAIGRRDEAFALDVAQDVLLRVAKKLPALANELAVRAWMTRAVCRAIQDRERAEHRRRRREQAVAARSDWRSPDAWQQLVTAERERWLQARLAELGAVDRALVLARFGDATVVAAGAAVGLGADEAHGRLRRIMDKLRRSAAEWWHG